jgi:hypothetical protein
MTTENLAAIAMNRPFITTEELASLLAVRPQSIRKQYCITGHYCGLRPTKLPNRFLGWKAADIEKLLEV